MAQENSWQKNSNNTSWTGSTPQNAQAPNPWDKNVFDVKTDAGLASTASPAFKPFTGEEALSNLRAGTAQAQQNLYGQAQGQAQNTWNALASRGGISSDMKDRVESGMQNQAMQGVQNLRGNELATQLQIKSGADKFNQEQLAEMYKKALEAQASLNMSREIADKDPIKYRDPDLEGDKNPGNTNYERDFGTGGRFPNASPAAQEEYNKLVGEGYTPTKDSNGNWYLKGSKSGEHKTGYWKIHKWKKRNQYRGFHYAYKNGKWVRQQYTYYK